MPLDYVGARKAARDLLGANADVQTWTAAGSVQFYAVGLWQTADGTRRFISVGIGRSWDEAVFDARSRQRS